MSKVKTFFADPLEKTDAVLAVPPYFSAIERQAVLDAAKVANINCLRLINENTAVALTYGFFRRKEFDEKKERFVAFIDFGHGNFSTTIASFTQKKVKILAHNSDRNLGARNFDALLLDKISDEFNSKYGCDPREAPRVRSRLLDAIEKARKVLSGIKETDISIECLMEDEDLHRHLAREEFEEIIKPDIERVQELMKKTLKESGLKTSDLNCVEIVGDGSRIPAV